MAASTSAGCNLEAQISSLKSQVLQETKEMIYCDNNATTRVDPEVVEVMLPFLTEYWGNPSSAYHFGHRLAEDVDRARTSVAELVGAEAGEIIFTSCGTESNNTALRSALLTQPGKRHIVTTAVEHSATIKYCRALEREGVEVTYLPVDGRGLLDPGSLRQAIRDDTALVSIMWANNETGMLFPIPEIAAVCRERGVLCHSDAVQCAGKLPVDLAAVPVDMLSLSAHKLHAPKGIGALFVRRKTKFQPYLIGGAQERGRRGGTENVPYIIGFGHAARLAMAQMAAEQQRIRSMRDRMEAELLQRIPRARLNGAPEPRLPNVTNLSFGDVEAEGVLMLLDQAGICASSGSACTTGSLEPSHVLTAMGCGPALARSSLRLSLGRYNTEADVDQVIAALPGIVETLRAHAPMAEPGPDNA
jgi:cysteine desulfurase